MPSNLLAGLPLRYLIGIDYYGPGADNQIWEVGYDVTLPPFNGLSIAYCNLFDEKNTGKYGPYIHDSDTAKDYDEGQIDPRGEGWDANLCQQFERRQAQGFVYIELDNPDAYKTRDVVNAVNLASTYGFTTIAKNALLCDQPITYAANPHVSGIIVEIDDDTAADQMPKNYDRLRQSAGVPDMPVWFVSNQDTGWAVKVARAIGAAKYVNMGVTCSLHGEYTDFTDILLPIPRT
jgi:hypothetical protein